MRTGGYWGLTADDLPSCSYRGAGDAQPGVTRRGRGTARPPAGMHFVPVLLPSRNRQKGKVHPLPAPTASVLVGHQPTRALERHAAVELGGLTNARRRAIRARRFRWWPTPDGASGLAANLSRGEPGFEASRRCGQVAMDPGLQLRYFVAQSENLVVGPTLRRTCVSGRAGPIDGRSALRTGHESGPEHHTPPRCFSRSLPASPRVVTMPHRVAPDRAQD
jgi:hypothetical protein